MLSYLKQKLHISVAELIFILSLYQLIDWHCYYAGLLLSAAWLISAIDFSNIVFSMKEKMPEKLVAILFALF